MATKRPKGIPKSMAMRLVVSVAFKSGKKPNRPIIGCQTFPVRKPSRSTSGSAKKRKDSRTRMNAIPTVMRMEKRAKRNSNVSMTTS